MPGWLRGGRVLALAVAAALTSVGLSQSGASGDTAVTTHGYLALIGSMHEHSGYSDGWPGSTPETYYASGRTQGLDFLAGSDHSDTLRVPVVASNYCIDPSTFTPLCIGGDPAHPLNALRKWKATLQYAHAASSADYTAIRGFEWTSDRFGHINVYFSKYNRNAKTDGGYAVMDTFYKWLTRPVSLGGGADGLATFNHPGDKKLFDGDTALDWNNFAYVPAADSHMVGIELYNDVKSYGSFYVQALDKGWHLGAVGAEDLGHRYSDIWGASDWGKTVMLATANTSGAIHDAMAARRFYAVGQGRNDTRLDFTVNGALMGSRLPLAAHAPLTIHAAVNQPGATIDVVTNAGEVVASANDTLDTVLPAPTARHYYFVRVRDAGHDIAFGSPVWVE